MAEKLELDSEVHDLVLGRSFDRSAPVAFHSLRYDFKSASADSSQAACVDVGDGNSVTVQIPHLEGSGTSHTLYKGNKRPTQKECVLIIDHDTGQITLERLATNVQLKKARLEGSTRPPPMPPAQPRPLTPSEKPSQASPPKKKPTVSDKLPPVVTKDMLLEQESKVIRPVLPHPATDGCGVDSPPSPSGVADMEISDSSSSDSDSDDESEVEVPVKKDRPPFHSTLSDDLHLSDSGSDSD